MHDSLVTEVEALRAEVLALRAAVERPRPHRLRWLALALALTSTLALADLIPFTENTPALAAEVNANFQQLKTWLETKTGPVTQAALTPAGGIVLPNGTGISSSRLGVSRPISIPFNGGIAEGSFSDTGGSVLLLVSATGYCTSVGRMAIEVLVDGFSQGLLRMLCDRVSSHMAFPSVAIPYARSAGTPATRTVRLVPVSCASGCSSSGTTAFADGNDFAEVTVVRLPTP